ncbi:hypothetical protein J437_LFUL003016 [Ladona fulva]|uniref:Uncharacterized protein n=1 Tax=Ladona fulva TaxID=123851 RepID=A0A8K0NRV5_LADFU|nr:hypothetical protein J437_LFUL003016 [Ladona fulva]
MEKRSRKAEDGVTVRRNRGQGGGESVSLEGGEGGRGNAAGEEVWRGRGGESGLGGKARVLRLIKSDYLLRDHVLALDHLTRAPVPALAPALVVVGFTLANQDRLRHIPAVSNLEVNSPGLVVRSGIVESGQGGGSKGVFSSSSSKVDNDGRIHYEVQAGRF